MKKIALFILLFGIINSTYSQKYKGFKRPAQANEEIGVALGVSNYLGDLAWKGDIPIIEETNPLAFRPAGGIFYRNNFTNFTSFRATFLIGNLYGNDAQTNADKTREIRNLHFRSVVAEMSLMLEVNLLPYRIGDKKKMIAPYFGIGIAGFYFNPQAELDGRWVDLQPLGTEGQGLLNGTQKYSLFQYAIPASIGLKVNITNRIALGMEFQYRLTFTDYIDDISADKYVSPDLFYDNYISAIARDADELSFRGLYENVSDRTQIGRGNPEYNDHYYYVLLSVSYKIGKSKISCPTF